MLHIRSFVKQNQPLKTNARSPGVLQVKAAVVSEDEKRSFLNQRGKTHLNLRGASQTLRPNTTWVQ